MLPCFRLSVFPGFLAQGISTSNDFAHPTLPAIPALSALLALFALPTRPALHSTPSLLMLPMLPPSPRVSSCSGCHGCRTPAHVALFVYLALSTLPILIALPKLSRSSPTPFFALPSSHFFSCFQQFWCLMPILLVLRFRRFRRFPCFPYFHYFPIFPYFPCLLCLPCLPRLRSSGTFRALNIFQASLSARPTQAFRAHCFSCAPHASRASNRLS